MLLFASLLIDYNNTRIHFPLEYDFLRKHIFNNTNEFHIILNIDKTISQLPLGVDTTVTVFIDSAGFEGITIGTVCPVERR